MRIGFDATAIPDKKAGAGYYIYNLIKNLYKVDKKNRYFIFVKENQKEDFIKTDVHNFKIIPLKILNVTERLKHEHFVIPNLIKRLEIDIYHSPHYTRPLFCPARSVVSFHDMSFFLLPELHLKKKSLFFKKMIRISSKKSDRIIAVSESTKNDIIRMLKIPDEKIKVIYSGVSENFIPIEKMRAKKFIRSFFNIKNRYILFVGRLEPRKNVPVLIRAYDKVKKNLNFPLKLVIVGNEGWKFKKIYETVRNLNLEKDVIFTGYIKEKYLPYFYSASEMFVYPSLYEGFGHPPLEAMACGCPVISSNVSSIPEIVGDAGILIKPEDEYQIATAILNLFKDKSLKKELSEKAIKRAKKFDWFKTAQETVKVYETL